MKLLQLFAILVCLLTGIAGSAQKAIVNGTDWKDTQGQWFL